LLLFHHAGGSAAAYHKWHRTLPEWVELVLVELPGRGRRFQEAPLTDFDETVRDLSGQIQLDVRAPYAFAGHSMGALLAFELAHEVPDVLGLALSAFLPPVTENVAARAQLSKLGNEELVKRIAKFAPIPPELARETEFLKMYMEIIRADLALIESYRPKSRAPLETPTQIFGGQSDAAVSPDKLEEWRVLTRVEGPVRVFPGDHFYINQHFPELLTVFLSMIQPLCAER
ncbi:MAG: alpha/beta fold hydrolase, partial [Bdellovibrionia bacterium]